MILKSQKLGSFALTSGATSLCLHFLWRGDSSTYITMLLMWAITIIHTKHHACHALSAQQMLNVIIINGPKSITKDKEGTKASSQGGNSRASELSSVYKRIMGSYIFGNVYQSALEF